MQSPAEVASCGIEFVLQVFPMAADASLSYITDAETPGEVKGPGQKRKVIHVNIHFGEKKKD